MPLRLHDRHALLALSKLAAAEQWCWNIHCSTCGHMYFRYALVAIANGAHPEAQDWPVHRSAGGWGPLPGPPFEMVQQRVLNELLSTLSVEDLSSTAPFPDWLGYLGLFLFYSADAEEITGAATHNLIPQLIELLGPESPSAAAIQSLGGRRLLCYDLETVEQGLLRRLGR